MTKSIDLVGGGPPGGAAADAPLPGIYDAVYVFYAQPTGMIKALHALVINMKTFTARCGGS